eukprot:scpid108665/ scgid12970/ Ankyrin repeat domain-containing protein 12; Ankyrin repeat-containing cofactor 2; GAC-1 protein
MGFTRRYAEMISIVKDRLKESRHPGEDLDPRTVYIDRHKIPAASACRINYVQSGTGVDENIEMPSSNMARLGAPTQRQEKELAASQERPEFLTTPERAGDTPLHKAAKQGNIDICRTLLDAGAEKNIGNSAGDTPLHCASKQHIFPIYEMLLAAGAENDSKNLAGDTPLH